MIRTVFLLLLSLVLFSCKPDFPSWESDYAFPLCKGTLTTENLIPDSLLQSDSSGFLSIYASYHFDNLSLDSLTTQIDTVASYAYNIPVSIQLPPGTQFIAINQQNRLQLDDVYFSLLRFSDGFLKVKTVNIYPQPIIIQYTITNAFLNNTAFSITREIPAAANPSTPFVYDENIDISGLEWKLYSAGHKHNCFDVQLKVWISPNATQSVQLTYDDTFNFFIGFSDFTMAYAQGYFGQHVYDLTKSFSFKPFENIKAELISLDDVKLKLDVSNGCGIDLQMKINNLVSQSNLTGNSLVFQSPMLNNSLNIARATQTGQGEGNVIPKNYSFNLSENSNLRQLLEIIPQQLTLETSLAVNPYGNISGGNDFYYADGLKADIIAEIPLKIAMKNLCFADTFSINSTLINKAVQSGHLRCKFMNSYPLEFNAELDFLDSLQNSVVTLHLPELIHPAVPGQNGRTNGKQETTSLIELDKTMCNLIREAKYIASKITVSSKPENYLCKIYSDYQIDFQINAFVKFLINAQNNNAQ